MPSRTIPPPLVRCAKICNDNAGLDYNTPPADVLSRSPIMPTMRALQVPAPGKAFQLVERPIPSPAPGQVRIKVQACGVCHSDALTKEGHWPGIAYPRVPGHELAGVIDAVGSEVPRWKAGQRVGVGWLGGYCGHCESCRRGSFITCANQQITGITMDGGYEDFV